MIMESEHYRLTVGITEMEAQPNRAIYQVINKEHEVIEYEDFYLPRSIEALHNLEAKLQEALSPPPVGLSLVPTEEEETNGEDPVHIH